MRALNHLKANHHPKASRPKASHLKASGFLVVALAAQPSLGRPLTLQWWAPVGCPGRDAVLSRISELGGSLVDQSPDDLAFEATVQRLPEGDFGLQILLNSPGERRARAIRGESCSALVEAAAVIVILALREAQAPRLAPAPPPAAPASPVSAPPERQESKAASPAPDLMAPSPRAPASSIPRPILPLARVEAGVDLQVFPEPAGLLSLGGAIPASRNLRVEAYTFVVFPQEVAEPARTQLSLAGQGARACAVSMASPITMAGCAEFEVGLLMGHTRDQQTEPGFGFALWSAPGLRLGLDVTIAGPVKLGIASEGLLVLQTHEFVVDRPEAPLVHALPRFTQRGLASLDIELP